MTPEGISGQGFQRFIYNPTRLHAALHLASAGDNYTFCKRVSCASEKIQTEAEASLLHVAEFSPVFLFLELISRRMCFGALSESAFLERRSQHIFSEPEQSCPH